MDMMRRKFIQSLSAFFAGYGMAQSGLARPVSDPSIKPRHVICFLGEWKSLTVAEKIVSEFGKGFTLDLEYSMSMPDVRMEKAFSASIDRVSKTFTSEDWARVKRHNTIAYVLSPPIEQDKALSISTVALELTTQLIRAGATAVKSESAGIAHGLDHWLYLAEKKAVRSAWVRRPIQEKQTLYSCGMHLLGQPDIECTGNFEALDAVRWIDELTEKFINEKAIPDRFTIDNLKAPAKHLQRVPCTRYAKDDFFFNPYGYVRINA